MKVSPTGKWRSDLVVPNIGIVRKPMGKEVMVAKSVGDWLMKEGYAIAYKEELTPPPAPAPTPSPSPPTPEPITSIPESPNWQDEAIAFLDSSSPEEIASSINGVGPATAAELKALDPITWEGVQGILSLRQRTSLEDIFNGS